MKATKSIELLNKGVADELQAVHQYMYCDKQLENIKRFGPNYLALQSFEQTSEPPAPAP